MTFAQTAWLGGLSGFTIYLGLPLGRMRALSERARVALAMFAVGILMFIFVDILGQARDMLAVAVTGLQQGKHSLGHLAVVTVLLLGGFLLGLAGLGVFERLSRERPDVERGTLRFGLLVAAAIGLHNLGEGLAIGVSARAGAVSLATVLIIGFALHNATEGFGIVGPLGNVTPSWRWLALAGLIGGGPTFVGTLVGYQVHTEYVQLVFYALAAGAILYVVGEIWNGMRRFGHRQIGLTLLSAGFAAGILTDLLVAYGGG